MFEMALAGDHHGQVIRFAIFDRVFIPDGTARLNKGRDTRRMCDLHTIIKGKEGITGQYRTIQAEVELLPTSAKIQSYLYDGWG